MSGELTDKGENWALDILTGRAAQATALTSYLGLFIVPPTDAGGGTEVSAAGYARMPLSMAISAPDVFGTNAASGQIVNTAEVLFAPITAAAGFICAGGIFDAITGGNLLAYGSLPGQIHAANDPVKFPVGSIVVRLQGYIGRGLVAATGVGSNLLLNLLFRSTTLASALTSHMALYTVMPDNMDAGGTEVAVAGYARQPVSVAGSTPDTFGTAAANGQIANTEAVTFTLSAAVANIAGAAIRDASTAGNLLCFCTIPSRPYAAGETCSFPAGSIVIGGN